MRHTGGGLQLVALTVLAVGCFAVPTVAKQDPQAANVPPGQAKTPPGQEKKQGSNPAATQPAPPAAQAPQQSPPGAQKHAAKQQAQAQHKAAKHGGASAATQTTRRPATTKLTPKQIKAAQKVAQPATATKKANGNGASAQAQTQTATSLPPGQAKKIPPPAPAAASAPAATSSGPVTTTGSLTPAKHRKAHRRTTTTRPGTTARRSSPVATITTAPAGSSNASASKTKATKNTAGGYIPAKPKAAPTSSGSPNVVLRTVRDAVEVIPATIWVLLGLLTFLASLFAVTSARQTRRAHRLAAERGTLLGDVGVLQEAVLPVVPPRVGALAVSVAHRPAGGPAAGGDFYDVVPLDGGRTALVVGDVSGHGASALGQATLVRFTLRAHLESGAGPREALAIAAESLTPHFDEGFATAAIAIHDPQAGTLTYATAAHEAPIVVGPGEHEPVLVASTPPLGIGGPVARRQTTLPFPEGSLATMLTDGALEARVRGELVGRARVGEWVRELGERPAAGDMAELIRSRAAVSDDLAVCFATSTAGDDTGCWRVEDLHDPTPQEADRFLQACGAGEPQRRSAAEALRFSRAGTILSVRFENDAVVAAEVLRSNSPNPVAA